MMCWARTSSAPGRKVSASSAPSSIASRAARASRYSKRLPGTMIASDGSSSRWLARPIRCISRDEPLGAPIWMTRSTSPQSTPRSRLAVQTRARSRPSAIAFSTLRRASSASEPWWIPIGRCCSLTAHRSWKISSARLRVLQKMRVVLCRSISRMTLSAAQRPLWPAQGILSSSGSMIESRAGAPGSPSTMSTISASPCGASQPWKASGSDTVAERPTRRSRGDEALQPGQRQREEVAALAGGEGVDLVDDDRAEIFEQQGAVLVAEQQAQRFGRGQKHLRRPHPLPRLAVGGRVAGPGLDPDRQAHLARSG